MSPEPLQRRGCHEPGLSSYFTKVCGHPTVLQIRSQVSKVGDRWPASISRYSLTLTPRRHAACPTDQPARLRLLEHPWEPRHRRTVGHRRESEKPPEPEGPSGFSTRNLAASVLACQASRSHERLRPPVQLADPVERLLTMQTPKASLGDAAHLVGLVRRPYLVG